MVVVDSRGVMLVYLQSKCIVCKVLHVSELMEGCCTLSGRSGGCENIVD